MARGFDLKFILLDTDFFDKEKTFLIEEKHGFEGGYIAVRLLLWIAEKGGYGAEWNPEVSPRYFAAKALGDKERAGKVAEIVKDLIGIGFFDEVALREGFLTSRKIVKNWLRAYKQFNRREAPTDGLPEYVLNIIRNSGATAEQPREDCAANAPQMRRNSGATAEQPSEICPLEKKRKEKNINNISPPAREENTQDGENGEPAQNGQTYTPEEHKEAERRIELWNQITQGTGAEYTEFYPQESLISRMIDRIRQEPREEIWRRVFENARDEPFRWTLPAVFNKPGNFDQLKITIQKPTGGASKSPPERFGMDRPGFGKEGYYQ